MAAQVWASDVTRDENFGWYEPWFGAEVDDKDRLQRSNQIAGSSLLGVARPVTDYPVCTLAIRGTPKGGKHLVTFENRNIMVSDRLADVLSAFDLGDGGFVPTRICKRDRSGALRDLGFGMNYWRVASRKKTMRHTESEGVTRFFNPETGITPESGREIWRTPSYYKIKPDDLVFDPSSQDGPDVWVEEGVNIRFFLSDSLVKALKREKLAGSFDLLRCRVAE